MRRVGWNVSVLAASTIAAVPLLASAQERRPAQAAPRSAGAGAPAPANAPDANRMRQILKDWERRSTLLKSLDVEIVRTDRSKAWGDEEYEGRAMLVSPDLAWLHFDKFEVDPKTNQKKKVGNERIVCNGKEVWQYRIDTKQIYIFPLGQDARQRALDEGPLPFLFNMKEAEALDRYVMALVNQTPECFVISVVPRKAIDQKSFTRAFLQLEKKTYLPSKIFLVSPDGQSSKEFLLKNVRQNLDIPMANFDPKPMGPPWQVIRDPGDQGNGQVGQQAPPRLGNQPAVQPAGGVRGSRR
jgi:TIGR03009 family protein